jgi:primosomal protein N' (replication factor Y)
VVPCVGLRALPSTEFDYLPPLPGGGDPVPSQGAVVAVPFGSRTVRAVVVGTAETPAVDTAALRRVEKVFEWRVSGELFELARELSAHYLAPLGACLRLVLPPHTTSRGAASRKVKWILPTGADPDGVRLTAKQRLVLQQMAGEARPVATVLAAAGVSRSVLGGLVKSGVVCLEERAATDDTAGSNPASGGGGPGQAVPVPTEEQAAALRELSEHLTAGEPRRALLWGVTGSGKTEVYLRLIEENEARGRSTIVLVPEIALTGALGDRFHSRLGEKVAVWHSGLSPARRRREYGRVCEGRATVVVGARSAVFAPVERLGLIVIDESHDSSYKHDDEPRYSARYAAWQRVKRSGGLLLEGTATPRCESLLENHTIVRMRERPGGAVLPHVEVVDMRRLGDGRRLAPITREALAEVLRRRQQAVVLLNRRGYAAFQLCEACGHVLMCDECDASLVLHRHTGRLVCHRCGAVSRPPGICPACGAASLSRGVPGTEHLQEELSSLVSSDRLFRLDSDVAGTASKAHAVLSSFQQARPGVLVGTQMVAKGHDISGVTLVVVADADVGLYLPDFRAAERTFQLLTQVVGRAGRGSLPARALVQTWNPGVSCITMAIEGDVAAFYKSELAGRKQLGFPPYRRLARLVISCPREHAVRDEAERVAQRLRRLECGFEVWGPARLPRVRGRYRSQVLVSAARDSLALEPLGAVCEKARRVLVKQGVDLMIDVDPEWFG